jgi:outer membrane protein assembly factor BamB
MVGGTPSHDGLAAGAPDPPYRVAWSAELEGGPEAGPVVGGGAVIVVGARSVAALDAATGEIRWESERSEGRAGPPAVAGELVIHSSGSHPGASVVARRLEDGREEWRYLAGAPVLGGVTVDGDRAYVGDREGDVSALDASTGEVDWEFEAQGRVETTPAVDDGVVVVVAEDYRTGAATAYGLDAESGEEEWRFSPSVAALGSSSPAVAGGTAYLGMGDLTMYARDLRTGSEQWAERAKAGFSAGTVPAATGQDLYLADVADLYRLDPDSGEERWSFRLPDLLLQTSPLVTETTVVFGDQEGLAAALDVASGRLVWKQRVGPGPIGPGAADGDHVYLASLGSDGKVVALENDPDGDLLDEASPTTLFPIRAVMNFAAAAAMVGLAVVVLFRFALRRAGPPEPGKEPS